MLKFWYQPSKAAEKTQAANYRIIMNEITYNLCVMKHLFFDDTLEIEMKAQQWEINDKHWE